MAITPNDLGGLRQGKGRIEIFGKALRVDAAAARVMRIIQHGEVDLDLGLGELTDGLIAARVKCVELGERIVGAAKAIFVSLGDLFDNGLAALG